MTTRRPRSYAAPDEFAVGRARTSRAAPEDVLSHLHPGAVLRGRYQLLAVLASGGTGSVWRAHDRVERVERALKSLPLDAGGAEVARRELEARVRTAHPGAMVVRDSFEDLGHAWLVMDLASGSLADLVERPGVDEQGRTGGVPLSLAEALYVTLALCDVLAAAHRAGVVHRDLKPQNVLVLVDGTVRLTDFGIAQLHADGHARTRTGALLGSLPWMAPEQRRDPRAVRPATDVYALAVTTAWMLLGRAPADLYVVAAGQELRAAGVPEALVHVVLRAGSWEPGERYPDAGAFGEAVRGCGVAAEAQCLHYTPGATPVQQPTTTPPSRRPDTVRTSDHARWVLALAGSVITGVLGMWTGSRWSFDADPVPAAAIDALPYCADAPQNFTTHQASGPREVIAAAFGDVNGDGVDDAMFTSQLDEVVWMYPGGPQARFEHPTVVPIGRTGSAAKAVDVDGDGSAELLVAEQEASRWAAYRIQKGPVPQLVRSWPEPHRSTWGVVHSTPGADDITYATRTDSCIVTRTLSAGNLHDRVCRWRAYGRPIVNVRAQGTIVVAQFATGGGVALDFSSGTPAEFARLDDADSLPYRLGVASRALSTTGTAVTVWTRPTGSPCVAAVIPSEAQAIGDWNADGIADVLTTKTCARCTSELNIFLGTMAAPSISELGRRHRE